jgi:hypothetical protein
LRIGRSQQARNLSQFSSGLADCGGNGIQALAWVAFNQRQKRLRTPVTVLLLKGLASAGERVALAVDQPLDLQRHFNVAAAIKPLAGSAFVGL